MKTDRKPSRLVAFIKRYMLWWYGGTLVLYAGMIPLTVIVFPATTLILSIFILFAGFTASVASFASALISAEQDRQTQALAEAIDDDEK